MAILKLLFLSIGLWVLLCAAVYVGHGLLLYPAPKTGPLEVPEGAEILKYASCEALYFPAQPGQKTLVYFHGNGDTLQSIFTLGERLKGLGFGVAMMEYPGYGDLKGKPSESTIIACGDQLLQLLEEEGIHQEDRILVGYSLGTGVAADLASRDGGRALILLAPFTSVVDEAFRILPFLPMSLLISDHFDTLSKAGEISVPVLLVHGTKDRTVPYEMSQKLLKTFPNATLFTVEGAGHTDLFREEVLEEIQAFAGQGT